jgi:hypothetical protein
MSAERARAPKAPPECVAAWEEFLAATWAAAERLARKRRRVLASMLTGRAPLALPPPQAARRRRAGRAPRERARGIGT